MSCRPVPLGGEEGPGSPRRATRPDGGEIRSRGLGMEGSKRPPCSGIGHSRDGGDDAQDTGGTPPPGLTVDEGAAG
jgi:hypothetical protein